MLELDSLNTILNPEADPENVAIQKYRRTNSAVQKIIGLGQVLMFRDSSGFYQEKGGF